MSGAVKGPACRLPSIDGPLGRPAAPWLDPIAGNAGLTHMQRAARREAEPGPGHGHANALVAHPLAQPKGTP